MPCVQMGCPITYTLVHPVFVVQDSYTLDGLDPEGEMGAVWLWVNGSIVMNAMEASSSPEPVLHTTSNNVPLRLCAPVLLCAVTPPCRSVPLYPGP